MSDFELFAYFAGCYAIGFAAFAFLWWLAGSALGDAIGDCFYH